ncbi:DUF998 domain-containing protein [Pengzhenrongella sicca]|uniref:DUF998 domain-containing protein n=1 Tax=Pengzhenrongella sicca TaxID=2819238 RepID=A0A8A4ZKG4_9MICO|nr:DUF998 domain-containing protein [Pengzhenrongella sicca]QTE30996.1 DUF998 domain-containing protein [Pengzhenrongella sicca]
MIPTTTSTGNASLSSATRSPVSRATTSLLGCGVVVGPLYVVTSLVQASTREGFDLGRHQWSLLMNGELGWVQITNVVLCGVMVVAFALGLRRALTGGRGARWAPRLIAVFGGSLIAAAIFRADPALGFPVGTPQGPGTVSWHGLLHIAAGGIGFSCFAAACFVLARRYAVEGRRGWAVFSRFAGVALLGGFAMVGSGQGSVASNLVFTGTVVLVWAWMSAVAVDRYRDLGLVTIG